MHCLAGGARPVWRGQRGGQSGQEDVEAAFEFGGAVVGGQDGGEAAEQGEFADRQPVQAQPQQVVGLVRVVDEFLQLVEHMAVQEAEQPCKGVTLAPYPGRSVHCLPWADQPAESPGHSLCAADEAKHVVGGVSGAPQHRPRVVGGWFGERPPGGPGERGDAG